MSGQAPEEWARHERHNDAPRCVVESCRQPLTHPDSVASGVCRRPGDEHDQVRAEAAQEPA